MKNLIKRTRFAIYILLWCVFMSCGIIQKEKWRNEFMDAVSNQIRCNDPFIDAINDGDLAKARLYCDSIGYYANKVDSIYTLMHAEENAP